MNILRFAWTTDKFGLGDMDGGQSMFGSGVTRHSEPTFTSSQYKSRHQLSVEDLFYFLFREWRKSWNFSYLHYQENE